MEAKKISVVIPVYNSANHLKATFDSLARQTLPAEDFEIICVNDCSTDNSREVIEQWAEKMPNLRLINLPQNTGGPMIPRNRGMEAASGRYIHFMDSDDFLGEEALERLYTAAETHHSDVIFGRHVGVNGRWVPNIMFEKGNTPRADLLTNKIVNSLAPHKMMRTSFLREHGIRFHEGAKAPNEDQWFVMQCYIKAKVITTLGDYDYYYVVARGNENFSKKVFPADEYFFIPHQIMKFIDKEVANPDVKRKLKWIYIDRVIRRENFHKHLMDLAFPLDAKQQWLQEGKKFLDAYLEDEMLTQADNVALEIIRLVQANDIAMVQSLARQKTQARAAKNKRPDVNFATLRKAGVKTYIRPSVNALAATAAFQPDKPFPVFPSIKGWVEIRQPDQDGGTYAAFVKQDDVRSSFEHKVRTLLSRMKGLLKKKLKRRKPATV